MVRTSGAGLGWFSLWQTGSTRRHGPSSRRRTARGVRATITCARQPPAAPLKHRRNGLSTHDAYTPAPRTALSPGKPAWRKPASPAHGFASRVGMGPAVGHVPVRIRIAHLSMHGGALVVGPARRSGKSSDAFHPTGRRDGGQTLRRCVRSLRCHRRGRLGPRAGEALWCLGCSGEGQAAAGRPALPSPPSPTHPSPSSFGIR